MLDADPAADRAVAPRPAVAPNGHDPSAAGPLWSLMLAVAAARRAGRHAGPLWLDGSGQVRPGAAAGRPGLAPDADGRWQLAGAWPPADQPDLRSLLALHGPLLSARPGQRLVVGHLGQSLDGRIATDGGDSRFVNGPEDLAHLHRLRALCDAVLVGAATVANDDPQLTTRHVPGPNPVRVVIDPSGRVRASHRISRDGAAPTLLVRAGAGRAPARCGGARLLPVPAGDDGIDPGVLLDHLAGRGLFVILVEGGGVTVSRFLAARRLDRLQLAIAPLIIGSGRQGIQLPAIERLCDGLRPAATLYPMGADMLWDLALGSPDLVAPTGSGRSPHGGLTPTRAGPGARP